MKNIFNKELAVASLLDSGQISMDLITLMKNKTKKRFLYNPDNPKKSFDVYIDKNPKDTRGYTEGSRNQSSRSD